MKRTGILILMMLAVFAASCRRRPLLEADYTVNVVMNLDRDIVIPKPDKPGSGGGLAPDVDEWKDIVSEIII